MPTNSDKGKKTALKENAFLRSKLALLSVNIQNQLMLLKATLENPTKDRILQIKEGLEKCLLEINREY